MRCDEAAESISALWDGERIAPDAAEHLGACEACQARLRDYVEMGAELRRVASMESWPEAKARVWEKKRTLMSTWWQKGWETMRVPRLAFGFLVVAVMTLGSSLVAIRARAHADGPVVMLNVSTADGQATPCALSTVDKRQQSCALMGMVDSKGGAYQVEFLSRDGSRIELGVRGKFGPSYVGTAIFSVADLEKLPERHYWFEPGEKLQAEIEGLGALIITGEWADHVPSFPEFQTIDPKNDELRIVSPLLLRNREVVLDLEGGRATSERKDQSVRFYEPGVGLYVVSLSPIKGAVEGKVVLNRITFEIQGQNYVLLTGAPIARSERVWIKLDPDFKIDGKIPEHPFIG